jgi:nucleotide-binding universal stress UspA family protein
MLGGFGFGQSLTGAGEPAPAAISAVPTGTVPARVAAWCEQQATFEHLLVPLDGSRFAEMALPMAEKLSRIYRTHLTLVTAVGEEAEYLRQTAERLRGHGLDVDYVVGDGSVVDVTRSTVEERGVDLVVTSTRGGSGARHWLTGGVASRIVQAISQPVLLVQSDGQDNGKSPPLKRLLVTLDGSETSELVMPYAMALSDTFQGEILLLSVPDVPEPTEFGASVDWVESKRTEAETEAWKYLDTIVAAVRDECPAVRTVVTGSRPASAIVDVSRSEGADMIIMATRGRGGIERLWVGSVTERVVQNTQLPVFLLPVHDGSTSEPQSPVREASVAALDSD